MLISVFMPRVIFPKIFVDIPSIILFERKKQGGFFLLCMTCTRHNGTIVTRFAPPPAKHIPVCAHWNAVCWHLGLAQILNVFLPMRYQLATCFSAMQLSTTSDAIFLSKALIEVDL